MKCRANVEFVLHAPQSAGSLAGFTRQHANYRHVTPRTWRKSWDKIGLTPIKCSQNNACWLILIVVFLSASPVALTFFFKVNTYYYHYVCTVQKQHNLIRIILKNLFT